MHLLVLSWLAFQIIVGRLSSTDIQVLQVPKICNNENKMKPTNPNAHTYVNGIDVKTHGYAVTHNIFLQ